MDVVLTKALKNILLGELDDSCGQSGLFCFSFPSNDFFNVHFNLYAALVKC